MKPDVPVVSAQLSSIVSVIHGFYPFMAMLCYL